MGEKWILYILSHHYAKTWVINQKTLKNVTVLMKGAMLFIWLKIIRVVTTSLNSIQEVGQEMLAWERVVFQKYQN